ncbi:hypothetical protein ElyMa_000359900 [Elysia marginata]|uniref:Uncharacterized protein n=1 Tax=Elysia marginata TaxID=1093978 RepID=A0AAV4FG51_9GAST|nr:hypothetical protein ElyMa_000359900 [Elysia marginata]
MGVACSFPNHHKEKTTVSKISVRQDGNKTAGRPTVLTSKASILSTSRDDVVKLHPDTHRKWIQPLPTPLPKGPQLITPDVSSYTLTTSTETEGEHHNLLFKHAAADEPTAGGGTDADRGGTYADRGGTYADRGGGDGFLGVATLHSGHSSVASDALSATGFSTRSSNSMSISSSLSTNTALTPSGLHKWKLPPRLESLPDPLRKLLLGHPDSLIDLVIRPDVINLKVIAPEEGGSLQVWKENHLAIVT